ncbi:MAG: hypothetical protein LUQ38_08885 [Methanotrichaceae archaeon]|nr:hypothetical protein [Methanotrichaceae archaeon]
MFDCPIRGIPIGGQNPWTIDYFDDKFLALFLEIISLKHELSKYQRQLSLMTDGKPNPEKILEVGSVEGAQTLMLENQGAFLEMKSDQSQIMIEKWIKWLSMMVS